MRSRIIPLLSFTLLNLATPAFLWASSSDVLQGRLWLTQSNLPNAYTSFANADSGDSEAKVLKSLSALALLQKASAITNYLNSFYITSPTNIWLARDQGYRTNANAPTPYRTEPALNTTQGVAILTNTILPVLHEVETDLATVTDTNILIPLGRAETGYPDINLDYGDILMIRALVASGISATHFFHSQNTVALLNDILSLEEAPGPATIEQWLQAFPDLAKSANPQELPLARAKAKESILLYNQASGWIRTNRIADQVRLFNLPGSLGASLGTLYTASLQEEEMFRTKLNEYAAGLDGPVLVTGVNGGAIDTFDAKPLFDGQRDLRSLTPPFRKNKVRQGTIVDPTFGGMWTTNSLPRLENLLLQETHYAAYDPYAFGLFIPPSITMEAIPQNSLSEAHQPPSAFLGLGSVWTHPIVRYQDLVNLFWINPITTEVSRLFSNSLDLDWGWIRDAKLEGNVLTLVVYEWSQDQARNRLVYLNLFNGHRTDGILLSESDFSIYRLIIGNEFLFAFGSDSFGSYAIQKIDKTTGVASVLTSIPSGFQGDTLSLDPLGNFLSFVFYGNDESTGSWGYFLRRVQASDGTIISQIPLNGVWSNLSTLAMANFNVAYGLANSWSEAGPTLSLYSLNFQNGDLLLVNPNLLPPGRVYSWNSFKLSLNKEKAFFLSYDGSWTNLQLHEINLTNGEPLSTYSLGGPNSSMYFQHFFEVPGRFLYAKRSGDISEDVLLNLSFFGMAHHGFDFSFTDSGQIRLPSGNVEHPIRFQLINDSSREFSETVSIQGVTDSSSEATFQPFALTILDNDGDGVGIFAVDQEGKEGRLDPDPLGIGLLAYNPIRYEVRRTGDTSAALAVKVDRNLILSVASPEDYEISGFDVDGETINIPAGQSSAEIVVSPKFDFQYPEGDESLVLQIQENPAYALTENVEASALILDSSVYEWWTYQNGLVVSNLPPTWDLDGDGSPNLLEMAFGRDPQIPDSSNSVQQGQDNEGYLTLTFKRWAGGTNQPDGSYVQYGVTYSPQSTSNLANPGSWSASSIETVSTVPATDGMETVTIRDTQSKNSTRRFIRILVSMNQ